MILMIRTRHVDMKGQESIPSPLKSTQERHKGRRPKMSEKQKPGDDELADGTYYWRVRSIKPGGKWKAWRILTVSGSEHENTEELREAKTK